MKTAIILFNLGGPASLDEVKPFLFNLFNDKAIIGLPQPFRYLLAKFISNRRTPIAKEIYEEIGGSSPILELTNAQADELSKKLAMLGEFKVFTAMRYAPPFASDIVAQVKDYQPDKIILLPLYPQFSTTTTQSFFDEWYKQAKKQKLKVQHQPICCYPFDNHFTDAHVKLIKPIYEEAKKYGNPRILFSAHGLPKKIVEKGDPYQWQVERTVAAIIRKLGEIDHVVCYQSKVGRLEWLKPATTDEIERSGRDNVPVVVVPIAFVSEHSETLVELDIEYKTLAYQANVPFYNRVPALATHPDFIDALVWLVEATRLYPNCSNSLGRQCPKEFGKCGFREWNK